MKAIALRLEAIITSSKKQLVAPVVQWSLYSPKNFTSLAHDATDAAALRLTACSGVTACSAGTAGCGLHLRGIAGAREPSARRGARKERVAGSTVYGAKSAGLVALQHWRAAIRDLAAVLKTILEGKTPGKGISLGFSNSIVIYAT